MMAKSMMVGMVPVIALVLNSLLKRLRLGNQSNLQKHPITVIAVRTTIKKAAAAVKIVNLSAPGL
jgi:hypothetical protein